MIINFDNFKDTLKNTSWDKQNNVYMTELTKYVINFDKFQEAFFKRFNKPVMCSMDALIKIKEEWYFIEFKNGKIDGKQKKNISRKVGHSIISFLENINEDISYCRNNVNFILVYNRKNNSVRNNQLLSDDYQLSEKRENLKTHLPGAAKNKYIPFFQMNRYQEVYFKSVFTYSQKEFDDFVLNNIV